MDNFGNEIKEIRKDLFELKTKEIPDLKNDILSDIHQNLVPKISKEMIQDIGINNNIVSSPNKRNWMIEKQSQINLKNE